MANASQCLRRLPRFLSLIIVVLGLCGCATQPTTVAYDPPGFFSALFHGLFAPIVLFGSLLFDIRVYAYPNSGFFYDLGFMIGLLPWARAGR